MVAAVRLNETNDGFISWVKAAIGRSIVASPPILLSIDHSSLRHDEVRPMPNERAPINVIVLCAAETTAQEMVIINMITNFDNG
jgi:hypothetical protein